jgi:hypothetical protein
MQLVQQELGAHEVPVKEDYENHNRKAEWHDNWRHNPLGHSIPPIGKGKDDETATGGLVCVQPD